MTTDQTHTELTGSSREPAPGVTLGTRVPAETPVEATVIVRRRAPLPQALVEGSETVSAADFADRYGADPADLALVTDTLTAAGLTIQGTNAAARSLQVSGPSSAFEQLFGTSLTAAESTAPDGTRTSHRHRSGPLFVPRSMTGVVVAVLGLDDRAQARALFRLAAPASVSTSYTPPQLGERYAFPAATDGTGQHLSVIELGGGFAQSDLDAYFASLHITGPTVTAVPVDGGANVAGQDPQGADGEVLLDLEVIGALAPAAALSCYFAPNTDRGFVDAIAAAAHATPTPTAISISWGGPESSWTAQGRAAMDAALADAAALGVTVTAAAGDNGSSDGATAGVHVDFPASSPHALACGGTRLPSLGSAESVWGGTAGDGATGGGVSADYPLPAWQQHAGVPAAATGTSSIDGAPGTASAAGAAGTTGAAATVARAKHGGRGVPDVAGNADPQTGWAIRVDGADQVIGGTSAVAPLWAALVARLAQALGRPLGLLAPQLYAGVTPGAAAAGFHDILTGSNGAYRAGPGWDPCTGLGSPRRCRPSAPAAGGGGIEWLIPGIAKHVGGPVTVLRARRRELPGLFLLVGFLLVGFDLINGLAPMRTATALAHGRSVLRLEHTIGITPEHSASHWLVQHHDLALVANWTYNLCQVLVTGAVIGWLWWRHRETWASLRWVLLGTNLLAMAVFWTYPVAPPRLLSGSGVVDTIAAVRVPFGWPPGIQPHEPGQFQALPSLHLAWASWVALAFWCVSRRALPRLIGALYLTCIGVVVIVTGAHSLVDVVTGVATTAVLAGCRAALMRRRRPPASQAPGARDGIGAWTSASSPNPSKAPPMTIN